MQGLRGHQHLRAQPPEVMMMSFVNFETMRRRRVVWRRGGAPVGGAASGHGLPDAAPAVRDPVLQHWPGLRARLDVGSR